MAPTQQLLAALASATHIEAIVSGQAFSGGHLSKEIWVSTAGTMTPTAEDGTSAPVTVVAGQVLKIQASKVTLAGGATGVVVW